MVNIADLLYEICEDDAVYEDGIDLAEAGLMDSFTVITLLERLEDEGVFIQLTRIDRTRLHTLRGIEELVEEELRRVNGE
ncbi:MAG: D-alanine--poly(phosphoribitol) ligase subunit 2 [Clostridia bacterium]|nr:D-alanine--poly(phosphoribitol) ligase subunit 2 [Clostridia bacterium]